MQKATALKPLLFSHLQDNFVPTSFFIFLFEKNWLEAITEKDPAIENQAINIDVRAIHQYNREELMDVLLFLYHKLNTIINCQIKIEQITQDYYEQIESIEKKDFATSASTVAVVLIWVFAIAFILYTNFSNPLEIDLFVFVVSTIILVAIAFVIQFIVGFLTLLIFSIFDPTRGKKKREIAALQHNLDNDETIASNNQLIQSIQTENAYVFYMNKLPENFRNLDDIVGMWILLNDFRATNFKEVANLVREEQFRNQVLASFDQLQENMDNITIKLDAINDNITYLNQLTKEQIEILYRIEDSINTGNQLAADNNFLLGLNLIR